MGKRATVSGKSATQAQTHSRDGGGREAISSSTPSAQLLGLQSAIGNRAVSHLLGGALPRANEPDKTPAVALSALASPGRPLDEPTRTRMEERFQHPFQHVRIHTGREASAAADALGAEAYTDGRQIVFGEGYAPGSSKGEEVLAHELGHVVAADRPGTVIDPHRITPADHASERQTIAASRSHAPGPLTAAPVGLALKRGESGERESKGVEKSKKDLKPESRQDLKNLQDAVMREVRLRLLEVQRYITAAVQDSEEKNLAALGKGTSVGWTYAVTSVTPVIVQLIRVNLWSTPYKEGAAAILGAGLPHTAIALAGLAVTGLLLNSLVEANEILATKKGVIKRLAEVPEKVFRVISERIAVNLPPLVAELFNTEDPVVAETLLSFTPSDLVDRIGIKKPTAHSVYLPVRRELEEKLTIWRLTFHERVSSSEYVRKVEEAKRQAKQETIDLYGPSSEAPPK